MEEGTGITTEKLNGFDLERWGGRGAKRGKRVRSSCSVRPLKITLVSLSVCSDGEKSD